MGADIHSFVILNNEWVEWLNPFPYRSYGVFGFIGDVRNYSQVSSGLEHRGIPPSFQDRVPQHYWDDFHSMTFFSLDELLAIDYNRIIENRRCTVQLAPNYTSGGETCEPGEGEKMPLSEFLGPAYMSMLQGFKAVQDKMGPIWIVVGFDS